MKRVLSTVVTTLAAVSFASMVFAADTTTPGAAPKTDTETSGGMNQTPSDTTQTPKKHKKRHHKKTKKTKKQMEQTTQPSGGEPTAPATPNKAPGGSTNDTGGTTNRGY